MCVDKIRNEGKGRTEMSIVRCLLRVCFLLQGGLEMIICPLPFLDRLMAISWTAEGGRKRDKGNAILPLWSNQLSSSRP